MAGPLTSILKCKIWHAFISVSLLGTFFSLQPQLQCNVLLSAFYERKIILITGKSCASPRPFHFSPSPFTLFHALVTVKGFTSSRLSPDQATDIVKTSSSELLHCTPDSFLPPPALGSSMGCSQVWVALWPQLCVREGCLKLVQWNSI